MLFLISNLYINLSLSIVIHVFSLTKQVWTAVGVSVLIASLSGYLGLIVSYQCNWPSGPTIILLCGGAYLLALAFYIIRQR